MKNEVRTYDINQDAKPNLKKSLSIRKIIYTEYFLVLFIILILFNIVINYFSIIIERQHKSSIDYVQVGELIEDINYSQELLKQYSLSTIDSRQANLLLGVTNSITEIKEKLPKLERSHKDSPPLYFLYRGLENGTNYIDDHIVALNATRLINQEQFYRDYLSLNNIYGYINIYADQYLTSLVIKNANNIEQEEKNFKRMKSLIYMFFIALVLLYFLIANKFSKILIKPIDIMVKEANKITHGMLDDKDIIIKGPKEYEFLENSMNQMKHSLSNRLVLMRENAELEKVIHEKQLDSVKIKHELESARLVSLQNQINPHFFFNTLNTLRMMCMMENADKSVDFVSDLASFFRYTLKHTEKVSIQEEIAFVDKYLKLQLARFSDKLTYSIGVDENCNTQIIPPLIIQPLVENAIKHGVEEMEGPGNIKIIVHKENKRVLINVIDNGSGLQYDINSILTNSSNKTHIGIKNIQERLELFYNKKANLRVSNRTPQNGTIATITIPYVGEIDV
jgi:sensor histidine kinase YesM